MKHPLKAAYASLKHHARARGKVFALTLAQFAAFVAENTYLDDKGNTKYSLHIDRKDARFGYEFWNIQVLSCSENSNKERRKGFVKYFQEQAVDPANCPF